MLLVAIKLTLPRLDDLLQCCLTRICVICLFLAAQNKLGVCLTGIGKAYLTAPTTECYFVRWVLALSQRVHPKDYSSIVWIEVSCLLLPCTFCLDSSACHGLYIVWSWSQHLMHLAKKPNGTLYYKYICVNPPIQWPWQLLINWNMVLMEKLPTCLLLGIEILTI